ncbi:hypothetical protein Pori4_00168 [Pseudomonas phage vB_PpuM-Pori-4]
MIDEAELGPTELQIKSDKWVGDKLAQFAKDHAELMTLTSPSVHIAQLIKDNTADLEDFYQGFQRWERMGDLVEWVRRGALQKDQGRDLSVERRDWCERHGFDPKEFND